MPDLDGRYSYGYNNTSLEICHTCKWKYGDGANYLGCGYYSITGKHRPHEKTGGENCEVYEKRVKGERKRSTVWTDMPCY